MEKTILDLLKKKFESLSEAVLIRQARKLAKTALTEEQATQAVEALTLQQVFESYADSRASEATQTAIKNYEARYNLKDGKSLKSDDEQDGEDVSAEDTEGKGGADDTGEKPPEGGKSKPAGDDAMTKAINTLIEQNRQISERLAHIESDKTARSRQRTLEGVIGKLPETLRKPYARISFDGLSEEDFVKEVESISQEVAATLNDMKVRGASFGRPLGGEGAQKPTDEATQKEADAIVKAMNVEL